MHMHAYENWGMRTTIEIPDWQRARLVELAARLGEKGFSRLVQEAIDLYLREIEQGDEGARRALEALGQLDDASAEHLEETVRTLRSKWR
jgi:predicted DNA-binding protein